MIRNHGNGSAVRDTAKLIETLKKVGVIKTKKRRARRSLAKDEIRQDNDMGPGFTQSVPPASSSDLILRNLPLLMNQPQGGFNQAQIEDIQRNYNQQIGLLQDQVQKQQEEQQRLRGMGMYIGGAISQLQQRIDRPTYGVSQPVDPFVGVEGSGDAVESEEGEMPDTNEQEMERTGPNININEDIDTTVAGAGFVEEEPQGIPNTPPTAQPEVERRIRRGQTPIGGFLSAGTLRALDDAGVGRPVYKRVEDLEYALESYATATNQRKPNVEANRKTLPSGKKEDKIETIKRLLNYLINQNK
jgi:hypothetical protein